MNDEYDHLRESADEAAGLRPRELKKLEDLDFANITIHSDYLPVVDPELTGTEVEVDEWSQVGTSEPPVQTELNGGQKYRLGNIYHVSLGLIGMMEGLIEDIEESLSFSPPDYTEVAPGQELLTTAHDHLNDIVGTLGDRIAWMEGNKR